ncbi:MAG: chromosomal replication initiator protein DnaA [Bacteroides sp.]|nr:chromosomal replication initiator protein DnaA [Bacteroides sp.]
MSAVDHVGLWNRCLEIIRDNLEEQAYKTWFLPIIPLKYEENELWLQVPSQFFYEYIDEHFIGLMSNAIHRVFGPETRLMYKVMVVENTGVELPPPPGSPVPQKVQKREVPQMPATDLDPHLKRDYNFETFIEGESNKLSRSVAEAVALNPAKTSFNPLFFHGASGVGKTHLSNAIGAKIRELYPEKRVLYVSAHLFQVQYMDAVRNNRQVDFMHFYQTIDVLIVDDIQEFAGATKTQNTFFHIFNHLHLNGKQLIVTSDRNPALLQGMEDRLITRFKWGMVAELEKPTVELRRNILRNKIRRDGLSFPPEVIDYIAENVSDSVRDLEGIIISIMAHSTVYNKEIDLELAKRIVRKVMHNESKVITVDDIIGTVCKHFNVDVATLHAKSRKREVVQARQVAMFLAKKHTDLSTTKIGALIGGRDHATVLHACKTVRDQQEVDKSFSEELEEITASLKSRN